MCVAKVVVETKKVAERGHQQMELVKDSVMLCDPATGLLFFFTLVTGPRRSSSPPRYHSTFM